MSTRLPVAKSVAVIVVPGVGDDGPGDTVRALADSLLRHPGDAGFTHAIADEVVVPPWDPLAIGPPSNDRSYTGARIRLSRADGPELTLYEMHWADLSRFPASLSGFVAALYGLLFQMSTTGLEALRPHAGPGGRPAARVARRLLELLSWVLAVPLMFLTGGLLLMMGALFVTLVFGDGKGSAAQGFMLVLIGVGLLAGGLLGGRFLRRHGWGTRTRLGHPMTWGAAIALGCIGATIWRFAATDDWQVATSDVLIGATAWGFRPLWMVIGGLGTLTVIPLAWLAFPGGADRQERGRAVLTALLSVVVSTVGLAVAGATIVAGVGGPMLKVLGSGTWIHRDTIHCLNNLSSWHLSKPCTGSVPAKWAQDLFGQALAPIVATLIIVAILVFVALIMCSDFIVCFFRRGSRDQKDWQVAFDGAMKYLGGRAHGILLALAVVVTSAAIVLVWTTGLKSDNSAGEKLALVGAGTSSLIAALFVLAKYLRGNLLKIPRRALDLPYDIATYIRNPHGSADDASSVEPPRRKILRRYAALARFIKTTEHADVLVIASHSQGTMLTYAFLMGDRFREMGEAQVLEGAWPPSPRAGMPGGPRLPETLELITFGSPVRQTYAARFPCQYEDISDPLAVSERIHPAAARITWTNLYCSGDYVGRAIWSSSPVDVPFASTSGNVTLQERCIGGGDHTAYWGSPEVAAEVLRAAGFSLNQRR